MSNEIGEYHPSRYKDFQIVSPVQRQDGTVILTKLTKKDDIPYEITIELIESEVPINKTFVLYSASDVSLLGEGNLAVGARILVNAYINSKQSTTDYFVYGKLLKEHLDRLRVKRT